MLLHFSENHLSLPCFYQFCMLTEWGCFIPLVCWLCWTWVQRNSASKSPTSGSSNFLMEKNMFVCLPWHRSSLGIIRIAQRVRPPSASMFNGLTLVCWDTGGELLKRMCLWCAHVCAPGSGNSSCPEQICKQASTAADVKVVKITHTCLTELGYPLEGERTSNRNEHCSFIHLTKLH